MIAWALQRIGSLAVPLLAQAILWLGAALLASVALVSIQTWRIGELKEAAALANAQAQAAAASAAATVRVLNAERAAADLKTEQAIADALANRPADVRTVTRTVERLTREDPQFAAARRPAELHALRVQQLRAVDEAHGD